MIKLTDEDRALLRGVINQLPLPEEEIARIAALDAIRDQVNELLDRDRLDNDAERFLEIKRLLQKSLKIQKELGWRDGEGRLTDGYLLD